MEWHNFYLKWKKYIAAMAIAVFGLSAAVPMQGCQTAEFEVSEADFAPQNSDADFSAEQENIFAEDAIDYIAQTFDFSSVESYSGDAYTIVNNNIPFFTEEEMTSVSYETYGDLDELGRCTVCTASIGQDLMPTEQRGNISSVKPTGWQKAEYDFVDGKYLYNRCHLIGYQLTAENANPNNLITGTRYLNIEGMLPFENMVADYIKETDNHVMYRVTPVFEGDNLVASGVLMEGKSVEDAGEGILFCVFAYNVQPGVVIDYATGDNSLANDTAAAAQENEQLSEEQMYVLNTGTHKFHKQDCGNAKTIKTENYAEFTGSREELLSAGYEPCKNCNP